MYNYIKTDEELRIERRIVLEKLSKFKVEYDKIVEAYNDAMNVWRSTKDPVMKREIHHEAWKLKDELIFGIVKRQINDLEYKLEQIDRRLYSKPTPTFGCIYDTYHDLDYASIELYGIRGSKL